MVRCESVGLKSSIDHAKTPRKWIAGVTAWNMEKGFVIPYGFEEFRACKALLPRANLVVTGFQKKEVFILNHCDGCTTL